MNTKGFLIVIALILVGVFAIVFVENYRVPSGNKVSDSINDVLDSTHEGVQEFREEVKDEIDDNTDDKP